MNGNSQSAGNYPSKQIQPKPYDPEWFHYEPAHIKWGTLPSYFSSFAFPLNSPPAGKEIIRRDGNRYILIEPGQDFKYGRLEPLKAPSGLFPRLVLPHIFRIYQLKLAAGIAPREARVIDLATTPSRNLVSTHTPATSPN
ncbi:hypothetical protein [Stomatohabitans albus]|uniref:hypothetical protein n=1 Tax=Stomatohabitans albus TaxID=3110766 RepID=UPI00300C973B